MWTALHSLSDLETGNRSVHAYGGVNTRAHCVEGLHSNCYTAKYWVWSDGLAPTHLIVRSKDLSESLFCNVKEKCFAPPLVAKVVRDVGTVT